MENMNGVCSKIKLVLLANWLYEADQNRIDSKALTRKIKIKSTLLVQVMKSG